MEEALKSWVRGQTPDYCAPFNKFSSRDLGVQSLFALGRLPELASCKGWGLGGVGGGGEVEGRLAGAGGVSAGDK